jgi:hypothetical protein
MPIKIGTNDLANMYDMAPGSMTYIVQNINSKMVRGVADKLHVPLFQALQLYAEFCEEPPESMFNQLNEKLQNAIRQEILADNHINTK